MVGPMFGPIETVIFDFDGTLVNTMPSVIKGLQEAVAVGSGKSVPVHDLVMTFGPAPLDVLRKWVPEERLMESFQHWIQFEKQAGPEDLRPFEGVPEMLEALKKGPYVLGIFTGRDREGTLRILKHNGWLGKYFTEATIVCGDDGFPPKPQPDSLNHLLTRMQSDPKTTLMVGDHPYDMMAGRAAGTRTAAALWDAPTVTKSHRAAYREGWKKWDNVPCDLRMEKPLSLIEWLQNGSS